MKQNKLNTIVNFVPRFFKAMRSKDTPRSAKLVGLAAIAYAVMPADLISDFIPVIGILDDAIVLPFLIYLATTMIPENMETERVKVKKDNYINVDDYEVR